MSWCPDTAKVSHKKMRHHEIHLSHVLKRCFFFVQIGQEEDVVLQLFRRPEEVAGRRTEVYSGHRFVRGFPRIRWGEAARHRSSIKWSHLHKHEHRTRHACQHCRACVCVWSFAAIIFVVCDCSVVWSVVLCVYVSLNVYWWCELQIGSGGGVFNRKTGDWCCNGVVWVVWVIKPCGGSRIPLDKITFCPSQYCTQENITTQTRTISPLNHKELHQRALTVILINLALRTRNYQLPTLTHTHILNCKHPRMNNIIVANAHSIHTRRCVLSASNPTPSHIRTHPHIKFIQNSLQPTKLHAFFHTHTYTTTTTLKTIHTHTIFHINYKTESIIIKHQHQKNT